LFGSLEVSFAVLPVPSQQRACFARDEIINHFEPSLRSNKLVECNIPAEIHTDTLAATVKRTGPSPGPSKNTFSMFKEFLRPGITMK